MRVLFDHTASGGLNRFGLKNELEASPYYGRVKAFGPVKIGPAKQYGGLVSLSHGEYSLKPGVFAFAPPETSPLTVTLAGDSRQIMFEGSARRKLVTTDAESFDLYPPDYDHVVTDYSATGPLESVIATAAGMLGLRYMAVNVRIPSPQVSYTATGQHQLLRIISDVAAFFAHWIRIESGTLYCGDMLANAEQYSGKVNRYPKTQYRTPEPHARFIAGDQSIIGSTAYGRKDYKVTPVCSISSAVVLEALYNIRTIMEQNTISIKMPVDSPLPQFGQRFDWVDRDIGYHAYMVARSLNYDFRSMPPTVTITGEGDFTK